MFTKVMPFFKSIHNYFLITFQIMTNKINDNIALCTFLLCVQYKTLTVNIISS